MNELEELLERTRWMQDQLSVLQQAIERLKRERDSVAVASGELAVTAHHAAAPASATTACTLEQDVSSDSALRRMARADADDERRALPRRRGNPIAVLVSRPDVPGSPFHGWVVDRSPEGLCLVAEEDIPAGTWLQVRSTDHPAGAGWFEVEVRNSRPERSVWILGCQFRSALSWSELRQLS